MWRAWTAEEESMLRELWGEYSERSIRDAFRRKRTWWAIYVHASRMRLPRGIPQGCISIHRAAKANGFSHQGMLSVLRWAGVPVRRTYTQPAYPSRPRSRRMPNVRCFVDEFEAREAVERWCSTESLVHAVQRIGVRFSTLKAWLVEDGVIGPETALGPGRGCGSFRLNPTDVDRARARRIRAA